MKKIFYLLMQCISQQTQAQQRDLAKFRITEAKNNGYDCSQYYFERKQYFVFYLNE